jgi:hypothetical protein
MLSASIYCPRIFAARQVHLAHGGFVGADHHGDLLWTEDSAFQEWCERHGLVPVN